MILITMNWRRPRTRKAAGNTRSCPQINFVKTCEIDETLAKCSNPVFHVRKISSFIEMQSVLVLHGLSYIQELSRCNNSTSLKHSPVIHFVEKKIIDGIHKSIKQLMDFQSTYKHAVQNEIKMLDTEDIRNIANKLY